jgi:DinB family protein
VQMPLGPTFFAPRFGMVADRFGVGWMVIVTPPAAGPRAEALAAQLEAKARDATATLQGLSDADWKKVTEAEKWPVGVTAHHAASALEVVPRVLEAMAAGQSLEPFQLGKIDELNAAHAREHAGCTKAETVALFQKGVAAASAAIRGLRDDQLARTGTLAPGIPPMTVERVIMLGLVHHVDEHFASIRKAIGR